MIKKISIEQLRLGMYIHDLNCSWIDHPFVRNRIKVENENILNKARATGVRELYIDTALGLDLATEEAITPVGRTSSSQPTPISPLQHSPAEEFLRAKKLYADAPKLVQNMMREVQLGKRVKLDQCELLVDAIVESVFRMPFALLPLAQMKSADQYTFQHSVSVAALSVAFGRVLELPRTEIRELAFGCLLGDIGKAKVPGFILNKPGALTLEEFAIMKTHAASTYNLLRNAVGVSDIAFNAATQHHERFDGDGYPRGLKGEEISLHGQIAAIADVYDAIVSIRVYRKGMPPTGALQKLYQWSGSHFNPVLVQAFIKGIGIYPAGSLVRLESERLAIVREVVPEKILQPVVQLVFNCNAMRHLEPKTVDLSISDDKIKSHESFDEWGLNQAMLVSTLN